MGVVASEARKALIQWCRLNNPLVRKLLMGWRHNAQSRWCFSSGGCRCFRAARTRHVSLLGTLHRCISWLGCLEQSRLNYMSLLLSYRDTPLQLFSHCGILCNKAGRETSKANILNPKTTFPGRQWCIPTSQWVRPRRIL